jgi:hypothetical protein
MRFTHIYPVIRTHTYKQQRRTRSENAQTILSIDMWRYGEMGMRVREFLGEREVQTRDEIQF